MSMFVIVCVQVHQCTQLCVYVLLYVCVDIHLCECAIASVGRSEVSICVDPPLPL